MRKIYVLLMILILVICVSAGYYYTKYAVNHNINNNKTTEKTSSQISKPSKQKVNLSKEDSDSIKTKIKGMTMDEKIGQLIIVGMDGLTINENSKKMIENYKVGGFIIYSENVKDSKQLLLLINSLKTTNSKNTAPLFMSIDQEGGVVDRMPSEFKKFPNNKAIGGKNNSNLSFFIGDAIAEEIKSVGFNIDFAPVLDINSNPKNPVIGDRSFGSNAEIVSKLGVQTMKGIQSGGIIPVVKHFPGHGDTSVDSHVGLPNVGNDLSRLENFEFLPFIEAIKNNADSIMIAHILLPKIDPKYPASFSKTIITDILRNKLSFNGVVITDDITMGAIIKNYNIGDVAVKSINAGSDIVLVAHGYYNEVSVINALKKAVEDKILSEERIDDSVYRVLKLKSKYKLTDNTIESVNINTINNKISIVLRNFSK